MFRNGGETHYHLNFFALGLNNVLCTEPFVLSCVAVKNRTHSCVYYLFLFSLLFIVSYEFDYFVIYMLECMN